MQHFRSMTRIAALLAGALLCGSTVAAEPRKIVVAQDGSGQFKTIAEAVESVKDATRDNPVDIVIKLGTYAETITTRDWINLIGENRDACVIRYDGGPDTTVAHKKHTLWATSTTMLRNLTIVGIRVKYCIHSDGGGPFVLSIENCVLRREYPAGEPKPYAAAFGIGLHRDQHIVMKDCLLEGDLPIYMHNWNDQQAPCSMTLEKCVLKGKDHALQIGCLGSKQRDFFVIHDSRLEGAKEVVRYENIRDVKGRASWNGQSEIELMGSGNVLGAIPGAAIRNDAQKRQSGIELAAQVKATNKSGVRLKEKYGTAQGRLQKSQAWSPVKTPGPHGLSAEYAEDCLVLTCPSEQENPQPFGCAGGPTGLLIEMPMMTEIRMRCDLGKKGLVQLYYCFAPDAWVAEWRPEWVGDANNPEAKIPVKTTEWQTYRLVARNPDNVRLFVDGVPQGIALKKIKHSAEYFQLRVHGHGNTVMIDRTLLTGALPAE